MDDKKWKMDKRDREYSLEWKKTERRELDPIELYNQRYEERQSKSREENGVRLDGLRENRGRRDRIRENMGGVREDRVKIDGAREDRERIDGIRKKSVGMDGLEADRVRMDGIGAGRTKEDRLRRNIHRDGRQGLSNYTEENRDRRQRVSNYTKEHRDSSYRAGKKKHRKKRSSRTVAHIIIAVVIIVIIGAGGYFLVNSSLLDTLSSRNIRTIDHENGNPSPQQQGSTSSVQQFQSQDSKTDTNREGLQDETSDSMITAVSGQLNSQSAILVDLDHNKVLLNKDGNTKIFPASLTKIMTAVVALENVDNLDEKIELGQEIFNTMFTQDASMAGFLPQEKVSAIDLLYGVILPSGGECCLGLAEYVAGSEEAFVEMMNQKAASLGMKNTHFTNSTGLQDWDHYTTAEDLAQLLGAALENETFKEIFSSEYHATSSTNLHPDGITFYSSMFKNMDSNKVSDGFIQGGKTGYTQEAGLCLASLATIKDKEYILVTAGAQGDHGTTQYNIEDAKLVYNSLSQ